MGMMAELQKYWNVGGGEEALGLVSYVVILYNGVIQTKYDFYE